MLVSFWLCLLSLNSHNPFKRFTWGHGTNKKHHISTITIPMFTKLTRVLTYCEERPPINLYDPSMRWSFQPTLQIKYIFSTCWRPMDTKLGKVMPYCERLPYLKVHDLLLTWRHLTNWKFYISAFKSVMATIPGCQLTEGYSARKR